jgi:hypothetical protein
MQLVSKRPPETTRINVGHRPGLSPIITGRLFWSGGAVRRDS